jgi:threonine/homoserine/homoserine lactone efflux protein
MLPAFVGISLVVIVTPGQDTALTIRNALVDGRRGGLLTALGVSVGQAIWALATSVGLAALIVAFEPALWR